MMMMNKTTNWACLARWRYAMLAQMTSDLESSDVQCCLANVDPIIHRFFMTHASIKEECH